MDLLLIIAGMLAASAAIGFALNRFVLARMKPGPKKAIAFAFSRAVFYAPALADLGHGVLAPSPLSIAVAYSFREFGPELDVMTFLFPTVVFLTSLAFAWSKAFGWWFSALAGAHLALFWGLPLAFDSFDTRVALLSVNALPWYPLHYLNLPTTRFGLFTFPNGLGWMWCLVVWTLAYGLLAIALMRLTAKRAALDA